MDNTPPTVTATLTSASARPRARQRARTTTASCGATEYSVDGGSWEEVHPLDGINDAQEESYDILPRLTPGPHVVVVRATDLLGNVSTARVDVP